MAHAAAMGVHGQDAFVNGFGRLAKRDAKLVFSRRDGRFA
jgi:hypothetical protein